MSVCIHVYVSFFCHINKLKLNFNIVITINLSITKTRHLWSLSFSSVIKMLNWITHYHYHYHYHYHCHCHCQCQCHCHRHCRGYPTLVYSALFFNLLSYLLLYCNLKMIVKNSKNLTLFYSCNILLNSFCN